MSAATRDGNWRKLWAKLTVSPRSTEREAGESAVWIAGLVANLPEEIQHGELLRLLQMTGLTGSTGTVRKGLM